MSKQANELLLNLLASGIDAAGAHCSPVEETPKRKGYDEPDDDDYKDKDKDKDKNKISFL